MAGRITQSRKVIMSKDEQATGGQKRDKKIQLCGWALFVTSACFFIAASLRAGDLISLAGGILFLLACLVFLVPLISTPRRPPDA
jgi:hypothetical protein